jgi:hypothetical protein
MNMDVAEIIVLVAILAVALTAALVINVSKDKERKHVPNYKALFIIGFSWIPVGIATHNPAFWAIGAVFLLTGLANKDKWKQETKWSDLPRRTRMLKIASAVVIAGLLLLLMALNLAKP